jgi:site-specific DNA-cytosine methylase
MRDADQPAFTVMTDGKMSHAPRALLVHPTADNDRFVCRDGTEPSFTLTRGDNMPRALLVSGTADCGVRESEEPSSTVVATVGAKAAMDRAMLPSGRVVSLTPRALARLMGLGDTYILPDRRSVACRILGNGVAIPMVNAVAGQFIEMLERSLV